MAGCCERLRNTNMDTRLRMTLMGFYVLTLVFTLMTSLSLGWSVRIMAGCPLYARISLSLGSENQTISLNDDTVWGDDVKCSFCIFAAVCGSILAIIWFWFYLLLSNFRVEDKHGVKVSPDTRLLLPSMAVNVPMAVIALVVACMISDGRSYLCANVRRSLKDDCSLPGQREWTYPVEGRHGFNYIRVSQYGAWFWVVSLLATIIVGAFRVHRFLQDGGEHGTYSMTSNSTSTSSLTSSDDLYSTSDSDLEEDKIGFYNPNYVQGSQVAKRYPGGPVVRLESVEEVEEVERGGQVPRLPSPVEPPATRLAPLTLPTGPGTGQEAGGDGAVKGATKKDRSGRHKSKKANS